MICKFCNSEIEENHVFCPFCGKSLNGEEPAPETPEKPKKNAWKLILSIVGAVLVMACLTVVLLIALGVDMKPPANDIFRKECYTAESDKVAKKSDVVVATVGDRELTNSQLQVYYRMQIQNFLSENASYLSYLGMDLSKPLSEQTCYSDNTKTWEQYFLETALKTWHNQQVVVLLGEEAGFDFTKQDDELKQLPEMLEQQAATAGHEDVQAMLSEVFGTNCDVEDYVSYVRILTLGSAFYESECVRLYPTDEEIETFYSENEEDFIESEITKEAGLNSVVRHILIEPPAEEKEDTEDTSDSTDPTEATTAEDEYTEAQWAACLAEAEKVLQEWKDGEATEQTFAELANKYSADGGSNTTGGLYQDVNVNAGYVEPFSDWACDSARQPGDTGLVKTQFGYHIMYFVSGEAYWKQTAVGALLSDRITAMIEEGLEKWPIETQYNKILMDELDWQ